MRAKYGAIAVRAKCQRKFDCRGRKSVNCELTFYGGSRLVGEGATAGSMAHYRSLVFSAVVVELR